jgi:glycerol-3-phosphate acyltransferase PlsX
MALVGQGLEIEPAAEVITMQDHAAQAARKKRHASMRVAFELHKAGRADAVVSAGNSGAMLALGLFVLRRIPGVDRPGVVTTLPTRRGVMALIDMGANVELRPLHLAQFAVLASTYARLLHHKARPRIGLLSNGEEAHKGTALTRGAHALLGAFAGGEECDYVGYVEGKDLFLGDGFTGNVALKTAEGAGQLILQLLKEEVLGSTLGKLGALLLRGPLLALKQKLDWAEYGGAPLVGVNGLPILAHGRSNGRAMRNAIRVAASLADGALVAALTERVTRHRALWAEVEPPGEADVNDSTQDPLDSGDAPR